MRSTLSRALVALAGGAKIALAQAPSSVAPYIAPAFPEELMSAGQVDRVAWLAYDHGGRNVYTAAAPDFKPLRITKFLEDDGIVLTDLSISDDGSTVTFLRGGVPNTRGWNAVPTGDPNGGESAVWTARTNGSGAWRLGQGSAPELSPDARTVAFVKDGQISAYHVSRTPSDSIERGLKPLIRAWGSNGSPRWSADGARLAFVSVRDNHSFVGVTGAKAGQVLYGPGRKSAELPFAK